jgi:nucleotide-binding universal stress UspA family protein
VGPLGARSPMGAAPVSTESDIEDVLGPSRKEFPGVDPRIKQRHAHPAMARLDESESRNAQLVVLGRHTPSEHRGGFAIGSVTRAVLHYAGCPLAVVG